MEQKKIVLGPTHARYTPLYLLSEQSFLRSHQWEI